MQSTLGGTQHGVLRRDELPRVIPQPCALHSSVPARFGFCPELAQFPYTGGLEPALANAGINRFCGKAILNRQTILEHPLEHRVAQQTRINRRLHPCFIASGGPPSNAACVAGEQSDERWIAMSHRDFVGELSRRRLSALPSDSTLLALSSTLPAPCFLTQRHAPAVRAGCAEPAAD